MSPASFSQSSPGWTQENEDHYFSRLDVESLSLTLCCLSEGPCVPALPGTGQLQTALAEL